MNKGITRTGVVSVVVIGILALSWTLWRARPPASSTLPRPPELTEAGRSAMRPPSGPWTRVEALGDIPRVCEAVERQVGARLGSLSDPRPSRSLADAIASEAASYLEVVLQGTPETLASYLEERGGTLDFSSVPKDRRDSLPVIWSGFRMRPVGIEGIVVRARPSGPLDRSAAPYGERAKIKLADTVARVPALRGQVRRTERGDLLIDGDSYEVIIPMLHEMEDRETPVFVGIVLTRSRSNGRVLPAATIVYAPNFVMIGSVPF